MSDRASTSSGLTETTATAAAGVPEWRREMGVRGEAGIGRFVEGRAGYELDGDQPQRRDPQYGTNWVLRGRRGGVGVILKYYASAGRYRNERRCLAALAGTGLVPVVLDAVEDELLVMTRLPGEDLQAAVAGMHGRGEDVRPVSREIGRALGRIGGVEAPADAGAFDLLPWRATPGESVAYYLERCRQIPHRVAAFDRPLFHESVRLLEAEAPLLDVRRRVLFHEDLWNAKVDGGRFAGFFDLEMARGGCDTMQLGVAIALCGPRGLDWGAVIEGYASETGRAIGAGDLRSALAMNHLYAWIRICRYGRWDGATSSADDLATAAADAPGYHDHLARGCMTLGNDVELREWFPSVGASGSGA